MAGTIPKDYRQMVKRLQREGLVLRLEHSGRHPVLVLSTGLPYSCVSTPSDWRSIKNTEAQIRRLTRSKDPGYTGSTLKRNVQPKDPR